MLRLSKPSPRASHPSRPPAATAVHTPAETPAGRKGSGPSATPRGELGVGAKDEMEARLEAQGVLERAPVQEEQEQGWQEMVEDQLVVEVVEEEAQTHRSYEEQEQLRGCHEARHSMQQRAGPEVCEGAAWRREEAVVMVRRARQPLPSCEPPPLLLYREVVLSLQQGLVHPRHSLVLRGGRFRVLMLDTVLCLWLLKIRSCLLLFSALVRVPIRVCVCARRRWRSLHVSLLVWRLFPSLCFVFGRD